MGSKPLVLKLVSAHNRQHSKLSKFTFIPYGGSNPYYYCSECQRSNIECNTHGHDPRCEHGKALNNLKSLESSIEKETIKFLEQKKYKSKSFINYVWQKQRSNVEGLDDLVKRINIYRKENENKEYIKENLK